MPLTVLLPALPLVIIGNMVLPLKRTRRSAAKEFPLDALVDLMTAIVLLPLLGETV